MSALSLSLGRVGCQGSGASAGPSQCELHVDAWARGAPAAEEGDAPKKKRGPGGPGGSGPGPNSGAGPIILSFYVILFTGISKELGKYHL